MRANTRLARALFAGGVVALAVACDPEPTPGEDGTGGASAGPEDLTIQEVTDTCCDEQNAFRNDVPICAEWLDLYHLDDADLCTIELPDLAEQPTAEEPFFPINACGVDCTSLAPGEVRGCIDGAVMELTGLNFDLEWFSENQPFWVLRRAGGTKSDASAINRFEFTMADNGFPLAGSYPLANNTDGPNVDFGGGVFDYATTNPEKRTYAYSREDLVGGYISFFRAVTERGDLAIGAADYRVNLSSYLTGPIVDSVPEGESHIQFCFAQSAAAP